jgi:hypothetical protein
LSFSIEQIKGEISRGGGVAKGNLFRVILPVIPQIYLNRTGLGVATPQSLNVLCKAASMPGRQLTTVDRTIGVESQKVAYGYANDDVSLTFLGLNDYVVRKYFEDWQHFALNPDNNTVRYKSDYARNVVVQQLDQLHNVVYSVTLEAAFPTQLLNLDFTNENGQPIDVTVTIAYTRWKRNNAISDFVSSEFQNVLEGVLLRN